MMPSESRCASRTRQPLRRDGTYARQRVAARRRDRARCRTATPTREPERVRTREQQPPLGARQFRDRRGTSAHSTSWASTADAARLAPGRAPGSARRASAGVEFGDRATMRRAAGHRRTSHGAGCPPDRGHAAIACRDGARPRDGTRGSTGTRCRRRGRVGRQIASATCFGGERHRSSTRRCGDRGVEWCRARRAAPRRRFGRPHRQQRRVRAPRASRRARLGGRDLEPHHVGSARAAVRGGRDPSTTPPPQAITRAPASSAWRSTSPSRRRKYASPRARTARRSCSPPPPRCSVQVGDRDAQPLAQDRGRRRSCPLPSGRPARAGGRGAPGIMCASLAHAAGGRIEHDDDGRRRIARRPRVRMTSRDYWLAMLARRAAASRR